MKLALIGGGSVRTYYFVESLIKFCQRLDITHLSIMDNDPVKLNIFGGFGEYLVRQAGDPLKVEITGDLEQAVRDADFVVTTIRVGKDEARCQDERIALRHNLIGQETTGAGGFSYATRSIPAMLEICGAIKRYAKPGAVTFNFTNPSGLVSQAMHDAGYEVIGICDNATGIKMDLSKALRCNSGEMFVRAYGLNHLSWADQVIIGGKNVLPALMQNDGFIENFHQFVYFDRDLVRSLGKIPNGYLYYFYHREKALANTLASPETRGEAIHRINEEMMEKLIPMDVKTQAAEMIEIYRHYMRLREGSYMHMEMGEAPPSHKEIDLNALGVPELSNENSVQKIYEGYAGVAFNYIESYLTGGPIDLVLCVPNNGAIVGLEDDDVVEVTCIVDKDGPHPIKIGAIPEDELNLVRLIKRYEKLTVQAIEERSIERATQALMQHPLVSSYSLAKALAREYAEVNTPYTGGWR